jgi:hypothetical protein
MEPSGPVQACNGIDLLFIYNVGLMAIYHDLYWVGV